jgi:hypothetical protein
MKDLILDPEFEYLRDLVYPKPTMYGYANLQIEGSLTAFVHHMVIGQPINRKIEVVDHINCNKLDNRIENLRIVSRRMNLLSTNKQWSKENHIGRGYYWCKKNKHYVLHNDFCPHFSHKDELVVARMFEYYALKEDVHYPCKFERFTDSDVKELLRGRKTKSKPGDRILVTYESTGTKGKNKGLLKFRFDYFLDATKTRTRKAFKNKTEVRKHAYQLLQLTKSKRIDYNWE